MTDRTPTSVNLRDDHREWMEDENINRSGFINDLIEEYRQSEGRMDAVIRNYQIQQLRADIEAEKSKVRSKENRLQELVDEQRERSNKLDVELDEARVALEDTPKEPTNPAIEKWAADLGMTTTELIEALSKDSGSDSDSDPGKDGGRE